MSKNIFDSSFSQFSFYELNLKPILEATTSILMVLVDVPSPNSPLTSYILSTPLLPLKTPTSLPPHLPQINIPSIFTIASPQIQTPILTSSSSLAPIFPTYPMIITPISVEIPFSQYQLVLLVTPLQETISASEGMTYFGEDVVVSLGKYFWSKKDKAVMKKRTRRMREGKIKHVPSLNQIIWNSNSLDIK